MEKNVIIISESASFPWGMAASNRVRNFAKGLQTEGWDVLYIGVKGAFVVKKKVATYKRRGIHHSISYWYPGPFAIRPRNWLLRRVDDIIAWLWTYAYLICKRIKNEIDVIFLYSRNHSVMAKVLLLARLLNVPVILDVCEWPLALEDKQSQKFVVAKKYCEDLLPRAAGAIPISLYIEEEIQKILFKKKASLMLYRIPIMIDIDRDADLGDKHTENCDGYLLYCGSLYYFDIAKMIVDILHELKAMGHNYPIIFTGSNSGDLFEELCRYADSKKVLDLLIFPGFLDEDTLLGMMKKSLCLLAPLPPTLQSRSRFPTKLGYYLESGSPVVTNKEGDVAFYLKDNENAFIADKYNAISFAKKISYVLKNKESANRVGNNGKVLAQNTFHYSIACKGIGEFFDNVLAKHFVLEFEGSKCQAGSRNDKFRGLPDEAYFSVMHSVKGL